MIKMIIKEMGIFNFVFGVISLIVEMGFVIYLFLPKCDASGCLALPMNHSKYCKEHAYRYQQNHYYYHKPSTSSSGGSKTSTTSTTGTGSSSNSYHSGSSYHHSSKSTMPDCDDYDSFEDFMDDWDGCMPNGMDAEDYWNDW